jgi:hypothetical protein
VPTADLGLSLSVNWYSTSLSNGGTESRKLNDLSKLRNPENKVIATYRDASKLEELNKLSSEQANTTRLDLVQLDMNDDGNCAVRN